MQSTFKFKILGKGVEGKVKVDFNFHEYLKDKSHKAPLEINIVSALELDNGSGLSLSQKDMIKKSLLTLLEELKSTLYNNHFKKA